MRLPGRRRIIFMALTAAGTVMMVGIVMFAHSGDIWKHSTAKRVFSLFDQRYSSAREATCKPYKGFENQKYEEINRRFEQRRVTVRDTCKRIQQRSSLECEITNVQNNMKYVIEKGIVYCAIEKTGSTFWKRILLVAGGWGNTSNPMDIKAGQAYKTGGGFQTLINSNLDELKDILRISSSIMFVRDSFTRIFSGWLDKFYSTNPSYWTNIGTHIVKLERQNATEKSLRCGHDVTFPEFVNYSVHRLKADSCFDGHFSSNYIHCMPCNLPLEYIGKYETLKKETNFLLSKLNLSNKVCFTDFERDAVKDVIRDEADWVFKKKSEILGCMSFRCGLFRVWKRLQSRGFISKTIEFPYTSNEEANTTTVEEFKARIKDAHDRSDLNTLKQSRHDALAMAFQLLSSDILKLMIETLDIDFEMFGYDRSPEFLKMTSPDKQEYFQMCPFD